MVFKMELSIKKLESLELFASLPVALQSMSDFLCMCVSVPKFPGKIDCKWEFLGIRKVLFICLPLGYLVEIMIKISF